MMNTSASAANGAHSPAPRVYLRIHHKRPRDGFVEDVPGSQYVRVQWDTAEMGAPPAPLQRALPTRTKCVFRRLPNPTDRRDAAEPQRGDGAPLSSSPKSNAAMDSTHRPPQTRMPRTHVDRVTRAGRCLVIECGEAGVTAGAASAVYVLDRRATDAEALEDAFGEFAVTDADDAGVAAVGGVFKRRRDANRDDVTDVFLAPVQRLTREQDHATAQRGTASSTAGASRWGPVEEDATGTTWTMLCAYDELLCVEEAGEAAADLYCYPDHRKDDEYDSNAEDFSGNDYPDDADGRSGSSSGADEAASLSSTGRHDRRGGGCAGYGMYCEEGYNERSLSSGWSSDDD